MISLDFELLWGIFDKVDHQKTFTYFQQTREVVPKILELFNEYEVAATWATVGMLFNSNWDEWNSNLPAILPDYVNKSLSAYRFGKNIQSTETEKLCFAPELIENIKECPLQEIGTHTYSHYYCKEKGQTTGSFKADLIKSVQIAAKRNITLDSLVFPRNQFNKEYLEVCVQMGIHNVRSNPDAWYWKEAERNSLKQKIFRTGDAYIGKHDKSYKLKAIRKNDTVVVEQKASRFLRPHQGKTILDKLRLKRIKAEMTHAAKNGEIYHLWWHPHNFGTHPKEGIEELRQILDHFQSCRERYDFRSYNMRGISEIHDV